MSHRRVDDETIIAGFNSLAEAMATGFDGVNAKIAKIDAAVETLRGEMATMRTELQSEFRNGLGGLEQRVMRRFDTIDGRLDDHERRITALEAKP